MSILTLVLFVRYLHIIVFNISELDIFTLQNERSMNTLSTAATNKVDSLSAPTLGQHTKSVLLGLGLTESEIDGLLSDNVIKVS